MDKHQQHPHGQRQCPRPTAWVVVGGWVRMQTVWTWPMVNPVSGSRFRHGVAAGGCRWLMVSLSPWHPRAPTPPPLPAVTSWRRGGGVSRRPRTHIWRAGVGDPPRARRQRCLVCRRLERRWGAVFRLRRALQRDAAARCRAYWAAHRERAADPKAVRERLGLSRKGIETAAKAHIEASGWMRDHMTKALGCTWPTKCGSSRSAPVRRRLGAPARATTDRVVVGFTRIPGRARSHTKATPPGRLPPGRHWTASGRLSAPSVARG